MIDRLVKRFNLIKGLNAYLALPEKPRPIKPAIVSEFSELLLMGKAFNNHQEWAKNLSIFKGGNLEKKLIEVGFDSYYFSSNYAKHDELKSLFGLPPYQIEALTLAPANDSSATPMASLSSPQYNDTDNLDFGGGVPMKEIKRVS